MQRYGKTDEKWMIIILLHPPTFKFFRTDQNPIFLVKQTQVDKLSFVTLAVRSQHRNIPTTSDSSHMGVDEGRTLEEQYIQ